MEVKKGNNFICIKDFESERGIISAIKGEIYHAKFDGWIAIKNNIFVGGGIIDEYFERVKKQEQYGKEIGTKRYCRVFTL